MDHWSGHGLVNPKLAGERDQARQMVKDQAANRPLPGTAIVTDKGLVGQGTVQFFATPQLNLTLIRPARKDERPPWSFPNWLRQRIEAINRGHHPDPEEPARPRTPRRPRPAGLWARVVQRLLALNAVIWFNWQIGAPVKRSLIAYDH